MLSFEARANDKQLDVDLQLPEDSMQVLADPDAITRVLYNLMDNAVKFAAPGSTLCVSLWKSEGKAYVSVARPRRDHPARRPAVHLRPLPRVRTAAAASTATAWGSDCIWSRASSTRTARTSPSRAATV
ncbi:MAG: sensor histidine kinase [Oscillospiraceae bacterium]